MPALPRPTDAELEILQVLWSRGPSTVRDVHDLLARQRSIVYTTVLKTLQVMHEKGLVFRDDDQRSHVYIAAAREEDVKKSAVDVVIDKVFGGSAAEVALHALSSKRASSAELQSIRALLDQLEGAPKKEK